MATKAKFALIPSDPLRLTPAFAERLVSLVVVAAVSAAIVFGWWHRRDPWLDPHEGMGYALGIIGGVLMLILLGYPLRKRLRKPTRALGSIGFWFRFHMLLGLIGPLAILYHARFSWGALNSAFALGSMIVVASSGLVGRFFYSRVHRGYSDRKLEMRDLKREMQDTLAALSANAGAVSGEVAELQAMEARAIAAGADFWRSAGAVVTLGLQTRRCERKMLRADPALRRSAGARATLRSYFIAVRRAAEYAFYDRLLRLWHLLHLPLFVLLVAAAVLHVIAVHMY